MRLKILTACCHTGAGLSSCALNYMEHFPYIDSLWYGESFDYQSGMSVHAGPNSTDQSYWFVEISGLPFGLGNDMLGEGLQWEPCFQSYKCTNPWRGMVYGMTARANGTDNKPIWAIWDAFSIQNATMLGWWEGHNCPVSINSANDSVVATVYTHVGRSGPSSANLTLGRTLIAIANFDNQPQTVSLNVNLTALGHEARERQTLMTAPAIRHFQNASTHVVGEPLHVPASRGFLLLLP